MRARGRVCVCEKEGEVVCVCEREEREGEFVCVRKRERGELCVCV